MFPCTCGCCKTIPAALRAITRNGVGVLRNVDAVKLMHGEWKTYTIDISDFGTSCTEFSFVIAGGKYHLFKGFGD